MRATRCGAQTRTGGACGHHAGWATAHPGTGRCALHDHQAAPAGQPPQPPATTLGLEPVRLLDAAAVTLRDGYFLARESLVGLAPEVRREVLIETADLVRIIRRVEAIRSDLRCSAPNPLRGQSRAPLPIN